MASIEETMTMTLSAFIEECKEQRLFIHEGSGKLRSSQLGKKDIHFRDLLRKCDLGAPLENVFTDRKDRTLAPLTIENFGKPCGCIWFSNGTWLRDPFNDCDSVEEFDNFKPGKHAVLITKSPTNILEIHTKEEFIEFCEEYSKVIEWSGKSYKDYRYID